MSLYHPAAKKTRTVTFYMCRLSTNTYLVTAKKGLTTLLPPSYHHHHQFSHIVYQLYSEIIDQYYYFIN